MTEFKLSCDYNEFLSVGEGDVNAIMTVSAEGASPGGGPVSGGAGGGGPGAVVLMIDVSGSMQGEKLHQANKATAAAIDALRDGTRFAILAGSHAAVAVYPFEGLVAASADSRRAAHKELRRVRASGGTCIGTWLDATAELLDDQTGVRQAILLTDGRNEGETPAQLEAALDDATGVFECHCRGVGTDWSVPELTDIAERLMGTVDIVADPAHLTQDFESVMREAMDKAVADVVLRVWTPAGAELGYLKQVAPILLTLDGTDSGLAQAVDFPIGAWGNETRDYHLSVGVTPNPVGEEMLAARVSVIVGGEPVAKSAVKVTWTEDIALSTRMNHQVKHYIGEQELAKAIRDGSAALEQGDDDTAAVRFGRAVHLAEQLGNTERREELAKVVEQDPDTGRIRVRKDASQAERMSLETHSTRTGRFRPAS